MKMKRYVQQDIELTSDQHIVEESIPRSDSTWTSFCCRCTKSKIQPDDGVPDKVNDCLKCCLSGFNLFYWGVGSALIGVGSWAITEKETYQSVSSLKADPAVALVATGILVIVFAFVGTVGSLRENNTFLRTYEVMMVFVVVTELAAVIYMILYWPGVKEKLGTKFISAIKKYQDNIDLQNVIDSVQQNFNCCGSNSYTDWDENIYMECDSKSMWECSVPFSCCRWTKTQTSPNIQCGYQVRKKHRLVVKELIYTRGCLNAVLEWFEDNYMKMCTLFGVVFLLPQMFGIIMTHIFINQIKEQIQAWNEYIQRRETIGDQ